MPGDHGHLYSKTFFKYILSQKETSIVKQVFNEQKCHPQRGDWINIVKKDLRKLKIGLSYEEITLMPKSSFKRLVKQKCEENALMFLKLHIKSKGKDITYEELEMRNYLKNKSLLRLQEKKEQG